MRAACCAVVMALPLVGGCEVFEETYTVQREALVDQNGVYIYEDLEEDFFGARWFQYTASNSNAFPICVRVSLASGASTSGHSMGRIIRIASGDTVDIGYVHLPASFGFNTEAWGTRADGTCGPPPN